MKSHLNSWGQRLCQPVDLASLSLFRVFFGMVMLWEVWRYFEYDRIHRYWIQPPFNFSYFGFEWLSPWPGFGMYVHFAALGILALCITVGLAYRWVMPLFWLGFTYVFLLEQTQYLNHFYLISLLSMLMCFVPAHGLYSLDARRNRVPTLIRGPAWALYLLRFQVAIVYFFGGVAKINGDWLQGEPIRMWLAGRGGEVAVYVICYGGLLFDLLIPFLLFWRKTRLWAFGLALFFHVTNSHLFHIGIFPWFMIGATTLFFHPSWPRRFIKITPADSSHPVFAPRTLTTTLLCLYVGVQLLVPLRHLLYPGNVNWTEEGHRFSWRMKLNKKQGKTTFYVYDQESSNRWRVRPLTLLPGWQVARLQTSPDQILQFAHYLDKEYGKRGYTNVKVCVDAAISLNGRKPQFMVDPHHDLSTTVRSLQHAKWILPLDDTPLLQHEIRP